MRLRNAILGAIVALLAGVALATTLAVSTVIHREAFRDLEESLVRARAVFEEQQAYGRTLHATQVRVVAEEPRLKAVVATEEITRDTVLGVASELQAAIHSDLFLMTDASGRLVVDVAHPEQSGHDMSKDPLIAKALADGDASGVWISGSEVLQVQARRLAFGTTVVGVLVLGHRVGDALAETVRRQTGSGVIVAIGQQAIARSAVDGLSSVDAAAAHLAGVSADGAPHEVTLEGHRYLVVASSFPGYAGAAALRYYTLRSVDRALAPGRRLLGLLYAVLGVAVLGGAALAFALSRKLAKPVDDLVALTERVAHGDLSARVPVEGPTEIRALSTSMNRMVSELEGARADAAKRERLEREMEIATRIQTSILPRKLQARGLEVAARMRPASEVGGDYYDLLPAPNGCWLGIGDVAGHGLTAGLVMMMMQGIVSALARANPDAPPRDLVTALNATVFDAVRERLQQDEHVTLSLLRYHEDGRVVFAGAHEELVVIRARDGRIDRVATEGTWIGAVRDVSRVTVDQELRLERGDLLALYTDGITEARDANGEQFGMDRFCALLAENASRPLEETIDRILDTVLEWETSREDDLTLVLVRYRGAET